MVSGTAKAKIQICEILMIRNDISKHFFSHFQANHPDGCEVIADDCNKVLREIMDRDQGIQSTERNLPQKGQVDLICGGPPCQGFSIMNIFQVRL